jgi:hypothetical protein
MNKFKLIPLAVLASLTMSSCDDLLEKDSMDTVTIDQYLTSDANLMSFTYSLYGPFTWTNYEAKFSWCANELTVGNVYHNFGDEGQFFFLNFGDANAHLLDGYQGLYGVISRCNMIINNIESQCGKDVSDGAKRRAMGEAHLFRGLCYFLLTEYWGETYLILNNENVIGGDNSFNVPKASRACLYAQAEKDFLEALDLLPEKRWGKQGERPAKCAAKGMLAKLYLTMGAASAENSEVKYKFVPSESFEKYNNLAVYYATEALKDAYLEEDKKKYEDLFWPKKYNQEVLFGLYFEEGSYGAGSCRQVHFARSKFLSGKADAWGGEKGLTVNLFKSFEDGDIRKDACCYYTNQENDQPINGSLDENNPTLGRTPVYKMYQDIDYAFYYNPSKTFADKKGNVLSPYGDEPMMPCLNACRKFVYGIHLTDKFSAPLTFAWLRTADLYLIRAEANMALVTGATAVQTETSAGNEDIDVIRRRAGIPLLGKKPVALYKTDLAEKTEVTYNGDDGKTFPSYVTYGDTYDLLEERRHEFALECQNWLDLKRVYYRNPVAAKEFIEHEDRAATYGQAYGVEKYVRGLKDLQRQKEINMIDPSQPAETELDYSNISWFFPIPSTIKGSGSNEAVYTDANAVRAGAYPY